MILPPNLSTMPFIQLQILQPVASLPRRICQNRFQNQKLTERKLKHRYSTNTDRQNRLCFKNLDLLCLQSSTVLLFRRLSSIALHRLWTQISNRSTRSFQSDTQTTTITTDSATKSRFFLHQVASESLIFTVSSIGFYSL